MGFLRGRLGSQIGRFLRSKIISYFCQKLALLTLLKTNFFLFFFCFFLGGGGGSCHSPTGATVQWNCHYIKGNDLWPSHIGNGIKEHKTASNWGLFYI